MYIHLVARTLGGARPFTDPDAAWKLWTWLRRGTPNALAACLMPTHAHQIEEIDDPVAARRSFASRLGAFARAQGWERLWDHVPEPKMLPDVKHLARDVRYVHLNPCRDGLVTDPLCWPWSTHRGAIGAELEPWVRPARLAKALGRREHGFAEWFHGYVSGDPTVAVAGTPFPIAAPSCAVASVPLAAVIAAAHAAAPRAHQARARRQLAVALAHDQGWHSAALIADALGISSRAVRRAAQAPCADSMRVARLYLADARLRAVPRAW